MPANKLSMHTLSCMGVFHLTSLVHTLENANMTAVWPSCPGQQHNEYYTSIVSLTSFPGPATNQYWAPCMTRIYAPCMATKNTYIVWNKHLLPSSQLFYIVWMLWICMKHKHAILTTVVFIRGVWTVRHPVTHPGHGQAAEVTGALELVVSACSYNILNLWRVGESIIVIIFSVLLLPNNIL